MILRRLSLHNFGCLHDEEFEFAEGLNIIRGLNEAGKSTLQAALLTILFEKVTTTRQAVRRWRSWGAPDMFRLTADFAAAGSDWRLVKDFAAEHTSLVEVDSGTEWTDHDQVQEKMAELVGTGSRDIYQSTAAIRQEQMTELAAGEEVGEVLQDSISGVAPGVSVPDILKKLDDALGDLQRGLEHHAPKNPGGLQIVKEQIAGLLDDLNELQQDSLKVSEARRQFRETKQELKEIEPRIDQTDDVLGRVDRRRKLEEQLEKIEEEWRELDGRVGQAKELQEEIEELSDSQQTGTNVGKLSAEAAQLQDEQREAQCKATELERKLQQTEEVMERSSPAVWSGATLIVGGLAVVAGTLGALFWSALWLLLGMGGLILVIIGLLGRRRGDYAAQVEQHDQFEAHLVKKRGNLVELRERISDLLTTAGVSTVGELHSLERADNQLQRKQAQLQGTLQSNTLEGLQEQLQQLVLDRATVQQQLKSPDLVHLDLDAMKIEELIGQLKQDKQRRDDLKNEQKEANFVVKHSDYDAEEELHTQEQLGAAQEQQARLRQKEAIYELTREVLAEAYQKTVAETTELLEPKVAELLATITRQHYETVRMSSDSLAPVAFSPAKGEEVESEELSCATRQQLYLAARLGLSEVLWPEQGPPLLLDDPLVNFDAQRDAATIELLARFAEARQILFFTCSPDFDCYAHRIVELSEPTE